MEARDTKPAVVVAALKKASLLEQVCCSLSLEEDKRLVHVVDVECEIEVVGANAAERSNSCSPPRIDSATDDFIISVYVRRLLPACGSFVNYSKNTR